MKKQTDVKPKLLNWNHTVVSNVYQTDIENIPF